MQRKESKVCENGTHRLLILLFLLMELRLHTSSSFEGVDECVAVVRTKARGYEHYSLVFVSGPQQI